MRDGTKEVSELYDAREQMRNTVKELREQLAAAQSRIAELERCVVMGGDGKPIAVGDPIFVSELHTARTEARVLSLYRQRSISGHEPCVEVIYDNGMKEGIEAIFCYSSPDSVPEGDK